MTKATRKKIKFINVATEKKKLIYAALGLTFRGVSSTKRVILLPVVYVTVSAPSGSQNGDSFHANNGSCCYCHQQ